ncbi:MAG: transcriptional repressor [Ruminococcaceae bacterium]|nr:transcriptional repressor [Oscillospiraceae bacterium]
MLRSLKVKTRRNTKQKAVILEALCKLNCHASASMVYEEVRKDNPTISRATVFRVLSDSAEDGKLLRIHFTGEDDRFDITLKPHYHISCPKCGYVADVELCGMKDPTEYVADSAGFAVQSHNLEFIGLCPKCIAESEIPGQ